MRGIQRHPAMARNEFLGGTAEYSCRPLIRFRMVSAHFMNTASVEQIIANIRGIR